MDGLSDAKVDSEPLDKLKANYDPNEDGLVTDAEARTGLNNMMGCLGEDCPFGSDPDPWIYHLGMGTLMAQSGLSQLSTLQLARNLLNTNYSGWVPDCPTRVRMTTPAPGGSYCPSATCSSATSTSVAYSTLAAGGEVVVQLKQTTCVDSKGECTWGRSSYKKDRGKGLSMDGAAAAKMMGKVSEKLSPRLSSPVPSRSTSSPPLLLSPAPRHLVTSSPPHPHVLLSSSHQYAAQYGDLGSTGDIFLALDVVGTKGVPKSRWVYTTNPAYLYVNPTTTSQLLTFGALKPKLAREKVVFLDNDCTYDTSNYTAAEKNAKYAGLPFFPLTTSSAFVLLSPPPPTPSFLHPLPPSFTHSLLPPQVCSHRQAHQAVPQDQPQEQGAHPRHAGLCGAGRRALHRQRSARVRAGRKLCVQLRGDG